MYKFENDLNSSHIHHRNSCVNHYTTRVAGGNACNFWQKYRNKNIRLWISKRKLIRKIFDYGKEAHRKQNIFWICKSNEKYVDF